MQGFKLIARPGIRLFVILPLLINTLLFSAVIAFGAHEIINLGDWISSKWQWAEWIIWLIWPLFVIIAVSVVFYGFTLVANLISAPFNGFLAEAVVIQLAGKTNKQTGGLAQLIQEIIAALRNELRKFVYFVLCALPLLFLFIVPIVNTLAPLVWLIFCSWLMALQYLDFPMSNQGMTFPEIRAKLRKRKSLAFGFGMSIMLMSLIPVLNFLAMPVAVTSASKLWFYELMPSDTDSR
ncbi:MAG: uncharacterized protein HW386_615 [Gammaproteobacteria bacterium]|nr:uncharacterized protein [Gammaproteobacteria bacterium]